MRNRLLLPALLGVLAVLGALVAAFVVRPATADRSASALSFEEEVLACHGVEEFSYDTAALGSYTAIAELNDVTPESMCVTQVQLLRLLAGMPRTEMLDSLATLYSNHPEISLNCHMATHVVGRTLDAAHESLEPYAKYLGSCAWGFLHGTIEASEFSKDPGTAGAQAVSLCDTVSRIVTSSFNNTAAASGGTICWHPVGHALYQQLGDRAAVLGLCHTAAPAGRKRFWCAQAVYMSATDGLVGEAREPLLAPSATPSDFASRAEQCRAESFGDTDLYDGCVVNVERMLLSDDSSLMGPYLRWCVTTGTVQAANGCVATAGEDLAVRAQKEPASASELLTSRCGDAGVFAQCITAASSVYPGLGATRDEMLQVLGPLAKRFAPSITDDDLLQYFQ